MADVVQETHQEFWQPPTPLMATEALEPSPAPMMAEACPRCGTEFLLGSSFCHTCGRRRPEAASQTALADAAEIAGLWELAVARVSTIIREFSPGQLWRNSKAPAWLRYFHFHEIQRRIGLSTASMIAFVIGMSCIVGALAVGFINTKTVVEWQAVQFYRAEWLLGAMAAFIAGILLRKPSNRDSE